MVDCNAHIPVVCVNANPQQAVEVDGGTTFETHFQYAKALKEGGDLVKFLEDADENEGDHGEENKSSYVDYYKRVRAYWANGL